MQISDEHVDMFTVCCLKVMLSMLNVKYISMNKMLSQMSDLCTLLLKRLYKNITDFISDLDLAILAKM